MTNLTLSQRYRRIRAMENGSLLLHFSDCPKIFISGVVVAIQTQGRATTRYKQSANLLPIVVNCTATWYVLTFTGAASFCKRLATCWFMLCKHIRMDKSLGVWRSFLDPIAPVRLSLRKLQVTGKISEVKIGKMLSPPSKKKHSSHGPHGSHPTSFCFTCHLGFTWNLHKKTRWQVWWSNMEILRVFWCFNIPVHDNCHWFSKLYLLGKHGKSAFFSPPSQGASA